MIVLHSRILSTSTDFDIDRCMSDQLVHIEFDALIPKDKVPYTIYLMMFLSFLHTRVQERKVRPKVTEIRDASLACHPMYKTKSGAQRLMRKRKQINKSESDKCKVPVR